MADGIIDVIVNQSALTRSIDRAFAASRTLQKPIDLKLNTRGFSQPLGKIRADLNEFDKSLDAASARVLAFGASVGVINGVSRAFRSLVKDTIAVEQALTEINVVLGASASQLQQFGRGLFDVARNTQQSFSAAAEAATEFSRQGLSLEQTLKRTNDALTLTRLSGLDAAKAVEALTAAVNGFSNAALTTSEVVNRLAAVDAAFAVSSQDLAESLSRAGSSAQDANVQFNELLALTTSVQQQTARGGAVIGNAFKTIFARISRGTSIDQLRELGVAINETQTGVERLRVIGQAIEEADGITANKIKEIAGGVRQINIISAAFRDLNRDISLFDGALEAANNSSDEAELKIAKLNKTLADLVNDASLNIQELSATLGSIGIGDNLRGLLEGFNSIVGGIVDAFSDSGIGTEIGKSILSGIGNFLTGPGLAAAAGIFLKIFGQIAKDSVSAVRSIAGLNTESERQANLQKAITTILTSQNAEYQSLLRNATTQAEREQVVLNILNQQVAAQERLQRISGSIAGSSTLRNFSVSRTGGIAKVPTAAGGMFPTGDGLIGALSRESAAISKGAGGASSGAKPVIIPNFNFGNGKVGPLVANSDEYLLKNADGKGGSAILTKQMVKDLGGPKAVEQLGGSRVPNAQDGTVDRRLFGNISKAVADATAKAAESPALVTNLGESFGDVFDKLSKDIEIKTQSKFGTEAIGGRAAAGQESERLDSRVIANRQVEAARNQEALLKNISRNLEVARETRFTQSAFDKFNSNERLNISERAVVTGQLRNQEFAARGLNKEQIDFVNKSDPEKLTPDIKKSIKEIDDAVNNRIKEQAKRAGAALREQRIGTENANLDAFRSAQSGQGRFSRLFRGSSQLPEFRNLTPAQQASVRQEQSFGGRFGRARAGLNRRFDNPIGVSFAASLAAPILQNAGQAAGNNLGGNALTVAGGAAGGAALGAILGPQGAAVGALIGGLKSLADIADSASQSIKTLSKALDEQQSAVTSTVNSIQQVVVNQQNLASLIRSGNARPEELEAAQRGLSSSIAGVTDSDARKSIRDILTDSSISFEESVNKLERILVEQQTQGQSQTNLLEGLLKASSAEVENRGFFNGFLGGGLGETDISNSQIGSIVAEFSAAISSFDGGRIDLIREALERTGKTLNESDIADTFNIIGLSAEQTKELLKTFGDDFDLPEFLRELKNSLDLSREGDEFLKFQSDYTISLIEANRAFGTVLSSINRLSRVRGIQSQRSFSNEQGEFDIRLAVSQFADPIARGLVELAKSNNAIAFEQRKGQEELAQQFRDGVSTLVSSGGTPEEILDLLKPLSTLDGDALDLNSDLLLNLIDSVNSQTGSENAQFDGVRNLLNSLLDSSIALESNTSEAVDAANRQFALAQARAREEQRQQNVNFLGGIESLLNSSPNRFQTFENRSILDRASASAGIFGGGASREAARGIVDFQQAFKDFGVDIRNFAPETERIVRDAVSSSIADFSARFPDLNLDIAGITDDITSELFGDNEITKQAAANAAAIGSNSTITNIESNTDSTQRAINALTANLQRDFGISEASSDLKAITDRQKALAESTNTFIKASKDANDAILDAVGSSTFNRTVTGQDVKTLAGDQFKIFTDRLNKIEDENSRVFIGLPRADISENELADKIAKAINEGRTGANTVAEVFNESEGVLKKFVNDLGLISNGGVSDRASRLSLNEGLLSGSPEIADLRRSIENNNKFIEFNKEVVSKELEEEAKAVGEALKNLKAGLDRSGNPIGSANSGAGQASAASAAARTPDTSGAEFEKAALNASFNAAASRRLETLFNVSGGAGGFVTGENGERELSNQAQRIQGVLTDFLEVAGKFSTKTEDEIIDSLNTLDTQLEALSSDLDNDAVKKFVESLIDARTDLLDQRTRQITSTANDFNKRNTSNQNNPSLSQVDQNSLIESALRYSQLLEKNGEDVEAFKKTLNFEIPDTGIKKFAFGFKSAADEMTEALGNIQDIGAQVANTLAEGFADVFLNAIDGSEDLGRSLRSLFSNLLADLARVQAQQAFSKLFSAVAGGFGGGAQTANTGGQILKRNSGGKIHKFNQGGRVPTLLTSGEFVAGPDLVKQYGLPFFQSLNSQSVNASGSSPASGKPLGNDTQGFVTGGSGTRDDRFHMLEAGSFVLNRASSERYSDVIGSLERGQKVEVDNRRPQRAFWGALIGQFLGGAATGVVGGALTAAITGEDIGKGALLGGLGGGIGGVISGGFSGGLKSSGNGFFSDVSSGFKSGLTFGLGDKKEGSANKDISAIGKEAGSAASDTLKGFNVLTEYTSPTGKNVSGSFLVGSDQQRLFESVNGTNKIFQQGGDLFAKQGNAFSGKKINLATGEVTKTGILQSDATKQLVSGAVLQLASSALAPKDPNSGADTSIPYEAGFVIDTDPNGTVTVMGEQGIQKFKLGPNGDIQSLDQLKGIVNGYARGGFISLDNFASTSTKNGFLSLVRDLALSTPDQSLASQGSFRRRAKSKNPVSSGIDSAIMDSLRSRGVQMRNMGGPIMSSAAMRETAIVNTPLGPMIVGGGAQPNRKEVAGELSALGSGRKLPDRSIATSAQKQVDGAIQSAFSKSYMDQVGASIQGLNFGGSVLGGLSGQDSVPTLLERGEFVQPQDAVGFFGEDFMRNVQNKNVGGIIKNIQRFEEGGQVQDNRGSNFSLGSSGGGESSSTMSGGGGLNGTITFDINFNLQSRGGGSQAEDASEAKKFEELVARLQPAIKATIANELRTGGQIANGIDNRG